MVNKRKSASEKLAKSSVKNDESKIDNNKSETNFDQNNNLDSAKAKNIATQSSEQLSKDGKATENNQAEKKTSRLAMNIEAGRFDDP
jgi:hypothetical protein